MRQARHNDVNPRIGERLLILALAIICGSQLNAASAPPRMASDPAGKLAIVVDGTSVAPIVVFQDAPPFTRQAADELAEYIAKTSGARPAVIEGTPDPIPEQAIWVGYQPVLKTLFPELDFDFQHPEEILIAANDKHLVIVGRDVWDPAKLKVSYPKPLGGRNPGSRGTVDIDGVQQEYGTCNAVYTFLQGCLGVRWLWPGEDGEDVLQQSTIAFEPFLYRYHPQFRQRAGVFNFSQLNRRGEGHSAEWLRKQRLQLDSLRVPAYHAFSTWWEKYHEEHPEWFALQPDGTRSGWPGERGAKLCEANPEVWAQWLKQVENDLAIDPNQTVFNATANDGGAQGFCVCENCRAWDPEEGPMVRYVWDGTSREEVAQSDRHLTFANHLGRLLKEKYPDKDYKLCIFAYGNARPAPVKTMPDDNVIVAAVFNFHNRPTEGRNADHLEMFLDWGKTGIQNWTWRPNLGGAAGWQLGMPNVGMRRAMDDLRLVAENGVVGLSFDSVWEHWANQGPYYYILAQMAWNPYADGEAIMADYYQRAYGPAAETMATYWELMESTSDEIVFDEETTEAEVWDEDFYRQATALLEEAEAAVAEAPAKFAKRLAFNRAGLEYMQLYYETDALIERLVQSKGEDKEAEAAARANWAQLKRIFTEHPTAFSPTRIGDPSEGGVGRMRRIHPDYYHGHRKLVATYQAPEGTDARLVPAEEAGWELAFSTDFDTNDLAENWNAVGGMWRIEDGALHGAGAISSARGFPTDGSPAYQRLEFEVMTDVPNKADGSAPKISDFSAVIHGVEADDADAFLTSGYFFQFGWKWNQRTRIQKLGDPIVADNDPETLITIGKPQQVVVENDGGMLRLFVDGKLVIATKDTSPALVGGGNNRFGLYFYTPVKVLNLKAYIKPTTIEAGWE